MYILSGLFDEYNVKKNCIYIKKKFCNIRNVLEIKYNLAE